MKNTKRILAVLLSALMLSGCVTRHGPSETEHPTGTSGTSGTSGTTLNTADSESETETDSGTTQPDDSSLTETTEPITTEPVTTEPQVTDPGVTTEPHTHTYTEGKTVGATCTAKGYTDYTCSVCGKEYREYTAALGHTYGEWVVVEATCEKTGTKSRSCIRCGKTTKTTLKKVKCHYADATCDKPRICIWCKQDDDGLPLYHAWDEGQWLTINPATGEGTKKYTCSKCGGTRDIIYDKNIPAELLDNPVIRAMKWLGYDVDGQIAAGDLYSVYGAFELSEKYRSPIFYDENAGAGLEGIETVAAPGSPTKKMPDLAKFQKRGLVCASFTAFFYMNYLPNVEGIDTEYISSALYGVGTHLRGAITWFKAFERLESQGKVTKIATSSQNIDRSVLTPGDVVLFSSERYRYSHVAVYAGTYRGEDYVIHCTSHRGVEFNTLSAIEDPYHDPDLPGSKVTFIYHINGIYEKPGT